MQQPIDICFGNHLKKLSLAESSVFSLMSIGYPSLLRNFFVCRAQLEQNIKPDLIVWIFDEYLINIVLNI